MAEDSAYPLFEAIAKQLYGDVLDPRELWDLRKNAPDTADVHVDGDGKKKKEPGGHRATATALLLGAGAEGASTFRAGQLLHRETQKPLPKVAADASLATKLKPIGTRAAKAGEFGLQAANLGVGLVAAHQLMKKPKVIRTPASKPTDKVAKALLRAKKIGMSPEELKAVQIGGATGTRIVVGGAALAGAALGHHVGYQRGKKRGAMEAQAGMVTKAFRVKPLNAADAPRVVSLKARRRPMAPPLAKAAPELVWSGEISKLDEDRHQVFGWCSLSSVDGQPVVDLQGDYVPLEEIEKSAYKYVLESRKGGDMHRRVSKFDTDEPLHTADLIESFVVTPDKLAGMGLAEDALPHGWWVGFKVNDEEQWQLVKQGKRAGFSIHGTGHRQAVAA